jgi:hypothetical protein
LPFAGTLVFQLGIFLSIAWAVQSAIASRSLQLGVTALVSLMLAAATLLLVFSERNWKFLRRHLVEDDDDASVLLAIAVFGITIGLGALCAVVIVQLNTVLPEFVLYAVLMSPPLLGFLYLAHEGFEIREVRVLLAWAMVTVGLGILPGSLLAAGFLARNMVAPLIIFLACGWAIGYLAYQAWQSTNMRAKFGAYAIAFILTYELWLLFERIAISWDAAMLALDR